MTHTPTLGMFEGRDVTHAEMKLTNVGDGLSKAMKLDPVVLHHGDRVLVLVEAEVVDVSHKPAIAGDLGGPVKRVHVLRGLAAMLTDTSANAKAIAKQKGRIDKLAEIDGQRSIDDEMGDDSDAADTDEDPGF